MKCIEQRRHATSQRVIEVAREYFENPNVRKSLGSLASELLEVAHMAEVPAIVNGNIQPLPDYLNRDVFPLTLMLRDETLVSTMLDCTPMQRNAIGRASTLVTSEGVVELPVIKPRSIILPQGNTGGTWASFEGWTEYGDKLTAERPLVGILPSNMRLMSLTAVHEFSHVHDFLSNPITDRSEEENALATELKAYAVEHTIVQNTAERGESSYDSASIEALRRRFNGPLHSDSAFDVSDALRHALLNAGLRNIW